jgi:hypothetical protein
MSEDVPKRYVQMFANYDKSMVQKVHSLQLRTQDAAKQDVYYGIPSVFATPERAFAQIRKQIARKRGLPEEKVTAFPLPIASIARLEQKLDLSRYVRFNFSRLTWIPNWQKYWGMVRPSPWDMIYQVDIWARHIHELDDLTTQLVLWLRADELYLTVDHPVPMGQRIVLTQFMGMTDSSGLDTGTEEKRTLRRTFSFVVHGWIVHDPTEVTLIDRIIIDLYDNIDELDPTWLERIVVPESEKGNQMGSINTSLYGVLIVGVAEAGKTYGNFIVPATASITGMQVNCLGRVPTGSDLIFKLVVNGSVDDDRKLTLMDGEQKDSVIFGYPLSVMAGDVLSVYVSQVGSTEPGDWLEVRFDASLSVS